MSWSGSSTPRSVPSTSPWGAQPGVAEQTPNLLLRFLRQNRRELGFLLHLTQVVSTPMVRLPPISEMGKWGAKEATGTWD